MPWLSVASQEFSEPFGASFGHRLRRQGIRGGLIGGQSAAAEVVAQEPPHLSLLVRPGPAVAPSVEDDGIEVLADIIVELGRCDLASQQVDRRRASSPFG